MSIAISFLFFLFNEFFQLGLIDLSLGEFLSEASKVGQETAHDAVNAAKEYVAAGAEKTQEVFNEYVREEKENSVDYSRPSGRTCCSRDIKCCERKSRRSCSCGN